MEKINIKKNEFQESSIEINWVCLFDFWFFVLFCFVFCFLLFNVNTLFDENLLKDFFQFIHSLIPLFLSPSNTLFFHCETSHDCRRRRRRRRQPSKQVHFSAMFFFRCCCCWLMKCYEWIFYLLKNSTKSATAMIR